jgi:hypothetical protein
LKYQNTLGSTEAAPRSERDFRTTRLPYLLQPDEHLKISGVAEAFKKRIGQVKQQLPPLFQEKISAPHSMRRTITARMLEAPGNRISPLAQMKGYTSNARLRHCKH